MQDFSTLRALFINCSLKPSTKKSHTDGLIGASQTIMKKQGVTTEVIRFVDYNIAFGVYPDMKEHGAEEDQWSEVYSKVTAADIVVIGTPIWLGEKSSVCSQCIERLYSQSSELNNKGQYAYYGKVGGCIITGNEDGIKHCSMNILYSLNHLGFSIPPQADAGWIGEVGPGDSYLSPKSPGPDNDFTNKNTTFMTWNLLHMAKLLQQNGGFPAYGNQLSEWKRGQRFGFEKPLRWRE